MSRKPTSAETGELERRYASGRDIEPEPGLDRIIRARAEQATKISRSHRPTRWLGGLATAAAVVLAIGVVLQQGVFESDALPTEFRQPAPTAERASPAPGAESPSSRPSLDRSETRAVRSRPADSDQAATLGQHALGEAREPFSGLATTRAPGEPEILAESVESEAMLAQAATMSEQELLDWIADLLEQGNLAKAGRLLLYIGESQSEAEDR